LGLLRFLFFVFGRNFKDYILIKETFFHSNISTKQSTKQKTLTFPLYSKKR